MAVLVEGFACVGQGALFLGFVAHQQASDLLFGQDFVDAAVAAVAVPDGFLDVLV